MKIKSCCLAAVTLILAQPLFPSPEGEANYLIAARYPLEVLNEDKIEVVDEIFTEDFQLISEYGQWSGVDRLKNVVRAMISQRTKCEILEQVASEEKVYMMVGLTYDWPDYAPSSDSEYTNTVVRHYVFWIKDGKISKLRMASSKIKQLKELSGFKGSFEEMVKALSSQ